MAFLLHQLLEESACRYPERPAVTFGSRTLTYRDLDAATDTFACVLLDRGLGRGSLVGLHLRRGVEAIIAMVGSLKAGATYVPLDTLSPGPRLRFIVDTCGIRLAATSRGDLAALGDALGGAPSLEHIVVMDGAGRDHAPVGAVPVVDWATVATAGRRDAPTQPTIDQDIAYVLFTSGSTGTPKGVTITHLNALTFVNAASDLFGVSENDRLSHV